AVTACGEARSGTARKSRVKRASRKQEENTARIQRVKLLEKPAEISERNRPGLFPPGTLAQHLALRLHRRSVHRVVTDHDTVEAPTHRPQEHVALPAPQRPRQLHHRSKLNVRQANHSTSTFTSPLPWQWQHSTLTGSRSLSLSSNT